MSETRISEASLGAALHLPIERVRASFPALRAAEGFVFFDNAAGAQIPDQALAEINRHLVGHNVQRGGRYGRSIEVDRAISRARAKIAAFLGADDPREVCLGMNATSFIRLVSQAIGQTLGSGRSEIIVTDMDHEANIATWRALEFGRVKIRWWRMREDGRLHVADLEPLLSRRTRLVACTAASRLAHEAGAELFLDAVHYAAHGPIDVKTFGCDYLVCSGYKIFGPHMGFLWGRFEVLKALPTFREGFIPDEPPHKIEAGTFIYENVSGMSATLDYLAGLGAGLNGEGALADRMATAMEAILAYEQTLSVRMLTVLREAGAEVYGIADPAAVDGRVPTFLFNLPGVHPARVAEGAAQQGFGIRDGHMYAPHLMARLGLDMDRGAVRISLSHYNTTEEIDRFAEVLRRIQG